MEVRNQLGTIDDSLQPSHKMIDKLSTTHSFTPNNTDTTKSLVVSSLKHLSPFDLRSERTSTADLISTQQATKPSSNIYSKVTSKEFSYISGDGDLPIQRIQKTRKVPNLGTKVNFPGSSIDATSHSQRKDTLQVDQHSNSISLSSLTEIPSVTTTPLGNQKQALTRKELFVTQETIDIHRNGSTQGQHFSDTKTSQTLNTSPMALKNAMSTASFGDKKESGLFPVPSIRNFEFSTRNSIVVPTLLNSSINITKQSVETLNQISDISSPKSSTSDKKTNTNYKVLSMYTPDFNSSHSIMPSTKENSQIKKDLSENLKENMMTSNTKHHRINTSVSAITLSRERQTKSLNSRKNDNTTNNSAMTSNSTLGFPKNVIPFSISKEEIDTRISQNANNTVVNLDKYSVENSGNFQPKTIGVALNHLTTNSDSSAESNKENSTKNRNRTDTDDSSDQYLTDINSRNVEYGNILVSNKTKVSLSSMVYSKRLLTTLPSGLKQFRKPVTPPTTQDNHSSINFKLSINGSSTTDRSSSISDNRVAPVSQRTGEQNSSESLISDNNNNKPRDNLLSQTSKSPLVRPEVLAKKNINTKDVLKRHKSRYGKKDAKLLSKKRKKNKKQKRSSQRPKFQSTNPDNSSKIKTDPLPDILVSSDKTSRTNARTTTKDTQTILTQEMKKTEDSFSSSFGSIHHKSAQSVPVISSSTQLNPRDFDEITTTKILINTLSNQRELQDRKQTGRRKSKIFITGQTKYIKKEESLKSSTFSSDAVTESSIVHGLFPVPSIRNFEFSTKNSIVVTSLLNSSINNTKQSVETLNQISDISSPKSSTSDKKTNTNYKVLSMYTPDFNSSHSIMPSTKENSQIKKDLSENLKENKMTSNTKHHRINTKRERTIRRKNKKRKDSASVSAITLSRERQTKSLNSRKNDNTTNNSAMTSNSTLGFPKNVIPFSISKEEIDTRISKNANNTVVNLDKYSVENSGNFQPKTIGVALNHLTTNSDSSAENNKENSTKNRNRIDTDDSSDQYLTDINSRNVEYGNILVSNKTKVSLSSMVYSKRLLTTLPSGLKQFRKPVTPPTTQDNHSSTNFKLSINGSSTTDRPSSISDNRVAPVSQRTGEQNSSESLISDNNNNKPRDNLLSQTSKSPLVRPEVLAKKNINTKDVLKRHKSRYGKKDAKLLSKKRKKNKKQKRSSQRPKFQSTNPDNSSKIKTDPLPDILVSSDKTSRTNTRTTTKDTQTILTQEMKKTEDSFSSSFGSIHHKSAQSVPVISSSTQLNPRDFDEITTTKILINTLSNQRELQDRKQTGHRKSKIFITGQSKYIKKEESLKSSTFSSDAVTDSSIVHGLFPVPSIRNFEFSTKNSIVVTSLLNSSINNTKQSVETLNQISDISSPKSSTSDKKTNTNYKVLSMYTPDFNSSHSIMPSTKENSQIKKDLSENLKENKMTSNTKHHRINTKRERTIRRKNKKRKDSASVSAITLSRERQTKSLNSRKNDNTTNNSAMTSNSTLGFPKNVIPFSISKEEIDTRISQNANNTVVNLDKYSVENSGNFQPKTIGVALNHLTTNSDSSAENNKENSTKNRNRPDTDDSSGQYLTDINSRNVEYGNILVSNKTKVSLSSMVYSKRLLTTLPSGLKQFRKPVTPPTTQDNHSSINFKLSINGSSTTDRSSSISDNRVAPVSQRTGEQNSSESLISDNNNNKPRDNLLSQTSKSPLVHPEVLAKKNINTKDVLKRHKSQYGKKDAKLLSKKRKKNKKQKRSSQRPKFQSTNPDNSSKIKTDPLPDILVSSDNTSRTNARTTTKDTQTILTQEMKKTDDSFSSSFGSIHHKSAQSVPVISSSTQLNPRDFDEITTTKILINTLSNQRELQDRKQTGRRKSKIFIMGQSKYIKKEESLKSSTFSSDAVTDFSIVYGLFPVPSIRNFEFSTKNSIVVTSLLNSSINNTKQSVETLNQISDISSPKSSTSDKKTNTNYKVLSMYTPDFNSSHSIMPSTKENSQIKKDLSENLKENKMTSNTKHHRINTKKGRTIRRKNKKRKESASVSAITLSRERQTKSLNSRKNDNTTNNSAMTSNSTLGFPKNLIPSSISKEEIDTPISQNANNTVVNLDKYSVENLGNFQPKTIGVALNHLTTNSESSVENNKENSTKNRNRPDTDDSSDQYLTDINSRNVEYGNILVSNKTKVSLSSMVYSKRLLTTLPSGLKQFRKPVTPPTTQDNHSSINFKLSINGSSTTDRPSSISDNRVAPVSQRTGEQTSSESLISDNNNKPRDNLLSQTSKSPLVRPEVLAKKNINTKDDLKGHKSRYGKKDAKLLPKKRKKNKKQKRSSQRPKFQSTNPDNSSKIKTDPLPDILVSSDKTSRTNARTTTKDTQTILTQEMKKTEDSFSSSFGSIHHKSAQSVPVISSSTQLNPRDFDEITTTKILLNTLSNQRELQDRKRTGRRKSKIFITGQTKYIKKEESLKSSTFSSDAVTDSSIVHGLGQRVRTHFSGTFKFFNETHKKKNSISVTSDVSDNLEDHSAEQRINDSVIYSKLMQRKRHPFQKLDSNQTQNLFPNSVYDSSVPGWESGSVMRVSSIKGRTSESLSPVNSRLSLLQQDSGESSSASIRTKPKLVFKSTSRNHIHYVSATTSATLFRQPAEKLDVTSTPSRPMSLNTFMTPSEVAISTIHNEKLTTLPVKTIINNKQSNRTFKCKKGAEGKKCRVSRKKGKTKLSTKSKGNKKQRSSSFNRRIRKSHTIVPVITLIPSNTDSTSRSASLKVVRLSSAANHAASTFGDNQTSLHSTQSSTSSLSEPSVSFGSVAVPSQHTLVLLQLPVSPVLTTAFHSKRILDSSQHISSSSMSETTTVIPSKVTGLDLRTSNTNLNNKDTQFYKFHDTVKQANLTPTSSIRNSLPTSLDFDTTASKIDSADSTMSVQPTKVTDEKQTSSPMKFITKPLYRSSLPIPRNRFSSLILRHSTSTSILPTRSGSKHRSMIDIDNSKYPIITSPTDKEAPQTTDIWTTKGSSQTTLITKGTSPTTTILTTKRTSPTTPTANEGSPTTPTTKRASPTTMRTSPITSTLTTKRVAPSTIILTTKKRTSPTIPITKRTTPTIPTSKRTSPTIPTKRRTSPTIPTKRRTSPTIPTTGRTSPTIPTTERSSQTIPTKRRTSPTIPTTERTSPTIPATKRTSPTIPTKKWTSPTIPTKTRTSPTIPTKKRTSPTIPTTKRTSPTIPTTRRTSRTIPTPERTSPTIPTTERTSPTIPTKRRTSRTIPTPERTSPTIPTTKRTSPTIPTKRRTSRTIPTPERTSPAIPTKTRTSPTIPTKKRTSPTIPTTKRTSPTIPTTRRTAPTIPTKKWTSPTIPTKKRTSPTIPTTESTSPTIPTMERTSPTIPTTERTSPTIPTKRWTSPTIPTTKRTSPTIPTIKRTFPTIPNKERISPTIPTTEGTSPTIPTTKRTSPTIPTTKRTSPTIPTTEGTSPTIPTTKRISPTIPTRGRTSTTMPTTKRTFPTIPTTNGTSPTIPTKERISPTIPTTEGTSPTIPTRRRTYTTIPITKRTFPTIPTTKRTSPTIPTKKRTPPTIPTTKKTSPTIPTTKRTSPPIPTTKRTSSTIPTTNTSPTIPTKRRTSPTIPTTKRTSSTISTTERTSPTIPTTKMTSPTITTKRRTSPTIPTTKRTSPNIPTTKRTSPTIPTTEKTSPTIPTKKWTSPTIPTTKRTSPTISTTERTSPTVPTTKRTSPKIPTTKRTSPTISTTERTSPTVPTTKRTSPNIPTTKRTSPTIPATKRTSPTIPTRKRTSPTIPTTERTSLTIPTKKETSPTIPTTKRASPIIPTKRRTSPTIPTKKRTSPTIPSTERTSPTIPTKRWTSPTIPTTKRVSPTIPTTKRTTPTIPTTKRTTPIIPTKRRTSTTMPTTKRTSPIIPTTKRTTPTIPTKKRISPTIPATKRTSPTIPATKRTSPTISATKRTSPTIPATKRTSPTIPATKRTSPTIPATKRTSPTIPTTKRTSPTIPTKKRTSQTIPTTKRTSPTIPTSLTTKTTIIKHNRLPSTTQSQSDIISTTTQTQSIPKTEHTAKPKQRSLTTQKEQEPTTSTQSLSSSIPSLEPDNSQPSLEPAMHEDLLVKCKVDKSVDIYGNQFLTNIQNGLVKSYLEGKALGKLPKSGSMKRRRKRLTKEQKTYDVHESNKISVDDCGENCRTETKVVDALIIRQIRQGPLIEVYFHMQENGSRVKAEEAVAIFARLQLQEISVNLKYAIFEQVSAIQHIQSQSQHPLKSSSTKWMMVTIAAPSIPVLCVICILLSSWYRNHARLRQKAMADISRGSQAAFGDSHALFHYKISLKTMTQEYHPSLKAACNIEYAESLADVGLEIDMEKGEIVSRAGSTSVLWSEDFVTPGTIENNQRAGYLDTDHESSRSNSWSAYTDPQAVFNSMRNKKKSPVEKHCQRNGKYAKKNSGTSFHFENNMEDECPPIYESFRPVLGSPKWPYTSTLQSNASSGRQPKEQQWQNNSPTSKTCSEASGQSQKLRLSLHANIISQFLADLENM